VWASRLGVQVVSLTTKITVEGVGFGRLYAVPFRSRGDMDQGCLYNSPGTLGFRRVILGILVWSGLESNSFCRLVIAIILVASARDGTVSQ
jgi:hypothetical protein